MRKLRLYIASSLDGKIARRNDEIDWLPELGEEDYGYQDFYDSIDTVLMGYRTYEVCLGLGDWHYKDKMSYIFSRDAGKKVLSDAKLISQDPVEFVSHLKQTSGGDIWLVGGGEIISKLHEAKLIDEYIIAIIPLILGEGIELLPAVKRQQDLVLNKQQVYPNGVILLYYGLE